MSKKYLENGYRPRVLTLITKDVKGEPHVLAVRNKSNPQSSPYNFPGGGTEGEPILRSAKREVLEEAGYRMKKPKVIQPPRSYNLPKSWVRSRPFKAKGIKQSIVHGRLGRRDMSLYNSEGDGIKGLKLYPLREVTDSLESFTNEASKHSPEKYHPFVVTNRDIIKSMRKIEKTGSARVGLDYEDITSLDRLTGKDKRQLARLIREASLDKEVGGYIHEGDPRRDRYLMRGDKGDIVGFLTPRKQVSRGKEYYRGGATYITPSERGKGHASKALTQFFKDRPGLVMIRRGNKPSERGYARAGFKNIGAVKSQADKDYDWYIKEAEKAKNHRVRDYRKEYLRDHAHKKAKDNRVKRNYWNRKINTPHGKEIDHKIPLSKGGGNGKENIRVTSVSENRSKGTKTASRYQAFASVIDKHGLNTYMAAKDRKELREFAERQREKARRFRRRALGKK